jgi:ParB family transcriptional regulator, chromosome partitioning protein
MSRQYARKPASWARRGPNARSDLGEESKARALARSRAKWQMNPLIARTNGLLIDGYRTIWGLELEGMLDVELDFILTDEELTPDQIRVMQANSAFHREPLGDVDKALVMRDTLVDNPGMTRKQMAEDVFDIDPSLPTRYIALFDCIQEVQDAARAGKLGVSEWYAISKSSDQLAALRRKLDGATRDELERQARKERDAGKPAVRSCRIKCPLPSGHVITVAGEELSLDEAIESLKEAIKAMTKARDTGLNAATAQKVWADMAKAG